MTGRFVTRLLRARTARLATTAEAMRTVLTQFAGADRQAAQHGVSELLGRVLGTALPSAMPPQAATSAGTGAFTQHSYTDAAGTRPYWLFVPAGLKPAPALVVMLHGCTQTAEDFAAGTRMNLLAERAGVLVLYPVQVSAANAQRCWNWFNPADQQRDGGEAALIAGMTRSVMVEYRVDPARVFVAGLSAGGAQAAILGATHPDLFAAAGVHSGLACGAATDLPGAFQAMAQGRPGRGRHGTRTIIFHGDRDGTVAARNAELVAAQVTRGGAVEVEQGQAPGGLAYTRSVERDARGRALVERWMVHGAGHAWSGGSAEGSYTEPRGPDASAAMLAFFLGK